MVVAAVRRVVARAVHRGSFRLGEGLSVEVLAVGVDYPVGCPRHSMFLGFGLWRGLSKISTALGRVSCNGGVEGEDTGGVVWASVGCVCGVCA